jgi:hypothetical protein
MLGYSMQIEVAVEKVKEEKAEFEYIITEGKNSKRATYKGRKCRILATGK